MIGMAKFMSRRCFLLACALLLAIMTPFGTAITDWPRPP